MIVAMRPQTAFIPSLLQQAFRDVSRGGVKLRSYISHDVPYLPPKFYLKFYPRLLRQRSDSSLEFLRIENKQIRTVPNGSSS